jgi:elongation factor G
MAFLPPLTSVVLRPKTIADREKMDIAMAKLAQHDPTFAVHTGPDAEQVVITAVDDLHLKTVIDRMMRGFTIEANLGNPQVIYRETILRQSEAEGKYIRQTGGSGNYGHVKIRLEPNQANGFEFISEIGGEVVPKEYIEPTQQGIRKAMLGGVLAGYEIVDVKVTLFGGSHHSVDSNEMSFEIAASIALKEAARRAAPVLLEPVVSIEAVVHEEHMGFFMEDLNARRGRIEAMENRAESQLVTASVPLSEMLGFDERTLTSTQRRTKLSMKFKRYEICPTKWFGGDEPGNQAAGFKGPRPRGGQSGQFKVA